MNSALCNRSHSGDETSATLSKNIRQKFLRKTYNLIKSFTEFYASAYYKKRYNINKYAIK